MPKIACLFNMVNKYPISVYYGKVVLKDGQSKTIHNIKYLQPAWGLFYWEEKSRHSELIRQLFAVPFPIDVTYLSPAESYSPGSLLTKPFEIFNSFLKFELANLTFGLPKV